MRNLRILEVVGAMSVLGLLAGCGGGGTSSKPPAPAGLASLPAKKIVSEASAAAKAADWVSAKAPASANMPAGTTDTLYVAATGKPLPVETVEAISTGDVIVTFTGWGQPVTVTKPVHTVPAPRGSGSA